MAAASALSVIAIAGGVALFSDSDETDPISVSTGSVEIAIDGVTGIPTDGFGDIDNIGPGQSQSLRIDLANTSTLDLDELTFGVAVDGDDANDVIDAGDDGFLFTLEVCDDPGTGGPCDGDYESTSITGSSLSGDINWNVDGDGVDILDVLDHDGDFAQLLLDVELADSADDLQGLDAQFTFHVFAEQQD